MSDCYKFNIKYDNGFMFRINRNFINSESTEDFDRQRFVDFNVLEFSHPQLGHQAIETNFSQAKLKLPKIRPEYGNLTCRFLLDAEMKVYKYFYNWFKYFGNKEQIMNASNIPTKEYNLYVYSTGTLFLLNNDLSESSRRFEYINLFPLSISEIKYSTVNNEIAPISIDVTFSIDEFEFID